MMFVRWLIGAHGSDMNSTCRRSTFPCQTFPVFSPYQPVPHAAASRAGKQRLEGKTYVVEDGDVLNVRFNV